MTTSTLEQETVQTLDIRKEIEIAAPIEITFEAVLEELGPGSELPDGKPMLMKIEPWPGGRWFRDLGNNAGHLWGHVQVIKPPALLELCGPMPMSYPAINHVQYRLKAEGNGTRLTIRHRAMGLIPAEHRDGMPEGWEHGLTRIREIAELPNECGPHRPEGNEVMNTTESVRRPSQAHGRTEEPARTSASCDIARSMLAEFEQELGTTRKFLERLPEDRLTWRPHEKSMTAGELAFHIAEVPAGVLKIALPDEASPPDLTNRPQPTTRREVLDVLDQCAAYVRQTLPTVDDDRMRKTFKIVIAGRVLMSPLRMEFLRSIMLNHWYHHRGQLGVYLRLVGVAVPSSYGPSADESPF